MCADRQTLTEPAARLHIGTATFSQHLRAAQREVLAELLDNGLVSSAVGE